MNEPPIQPPSQPAIQPPGRPKRGRPFTHGPQEHPPIHVEGIGPVGVCAGCNAIRRLDACTLGNTIATTAHLCRPCQRRLRANRISLSRSCGDEGQHVH